MFALSELLGQSSAICIAQGSRTKSRTAGGYGAWMIAACVAAVYVAVSVAMLRNEMPGWTGFIQGPTTWTGLSSVASVIFIIVGGFVTAGQFIAAFSGRRRFRFHRV